jgi:hypothetical protein
MQFRLRTLLIVVASLAVAFALCLVAMALLFWVISIGGP